MPAPYTAIQTVAASVVTATGETVAQLTDRLKAGAGWSMLITTVTGGIRWRIDGTDPTTSAGHLLAAGGSTTISGGGNILAFEMIRDGSTSATVTTTLTARGA